LPYELALAPGQMLDPVGHALRWYWEWAGSNIGAMPGCALAGVLVGAPLTWLFRDRIGRGLSGWWRRHLGHGAEIDELRATAGKAHRIAADLYLHHTGSHHPDAPGGPHEHP
jgi:hypothetical protein